MACLTCLGNFILTTTYCEAQRVLEEAKGRVLSDENRDIALEALDNPPVANEALRKIMRDAKQRYE